MEKDQLGFACPRCGIDLVLPLSAAGVEGPCPRCGSIIRAPRIVAADADPVPVRLEVPQEVSVSRPKPVAAAYQSSPVLSTVTEPAGHESSRSGMRTGLVILGALSALALVFTAVGLIRSKGERARRTTDGNAPRKVVSPPAGTAADGEGPSNPALDPRVPPEGMDVAAVISRSAEVLGKFLTLSTLDERMPLIETDAPGEELRNSLLAKPLPVLSSFASTEVRFNKVESATDVAFKASFLKEDGTHDVELLLVRTRGTQEPKVVVDSFLDGYGGRIEAFAKTPVKGEQVFRSVITIFNFCTDEEVPDFRNKFTVKLSSRPGGPDLAKAYFSASSPLAHKLVKSRLVFGHSTAATLVLRWTGDPVPFIEVSDVKSLTWDD